MTLRLLTLLLTFLVLSLAWAQQGGQQTEPPPGTPPATTPPKDDAPKLSPEQLAEIQKLLDERAARQREDIRRAELEGVSTRLGDIGRFRGARSNVLQGIGLIVGLNGTGDSKSTPWTATLISNALTRWGTSVDTRQVQAKNIATVLVTAEMPAFVAPGTKIDVTVSSNGDAKSLEGGVLMPTVLTSMTDPETVFATAYGSVSIGGFNASSGGSGVRKNHPNVGIVAGGAMVERSVRTQILFEGNVMYFDLDTPDFTTAERARDALQSAYPDWTVETVDGATVKLTLPPGTTATDAAQRVELTQVYANTPASVVVNERTGTIVVGGNVRLGPAVIAHGSLEVRIATDYVVSQPAPFSKGETVVVAVPEVDAQETSAQTAVVAPTATLDDLAKVLQTMRVTARDMIAILMALQKQGALKARIVVQ